MSREDVRNDLNDIFREAFMDSSIFLYDETTAKDIEDWDSLMQITLVTAIEKKYDVQFSLDDVMKLKNVGDMINLVIRTKNG